MNQPGVRRVKAARVQVEGRQLVREVGFDIQKTALATQTEGETDISYTWILARKTFEGLPEFAVRQLMHLMVVREVKCVRDLGDLVIEIPA